MSENGDGVMAGMPAVVIRDHGDGRVADLRLAGKLTCGIFVMPMTASSPAR